MTDTSKKSRKKRNIIIICIAVLIAAALVTVLIKNKTSAVNSQSGTMTVAASRMTIEKTLESDGEVVSSLEENVLPHTSYYLDEINVEEGEAVPEDGVILTYTNGYTMKAPYNCVVEGWDLPDEDDQLTSDHYVTIAGTDVMQMEISVSESDVSDISVGDSASVTVDAAGSTYEGEVSYISQAGDYSGGTSTFTAKIRFDNDGNLKLGMSGTAVVSLDRAENVIAVPVGAVNTRGGSSFVTIVDESGSQTQTEVTTGINNGSFVEIKSGLSEGDNVLVTVSEDSSSGWQGDGMMGGMGGGPGGDMGGMPDGGGGPEGSGEHSHDHSGS